MEHKNPILDTISYNDTVPKLVVHTTNKQECIWTWQYHPHAEFIVVLDGMIELQVREEKRLLTPGDGALIFPFEPHCYTYNETMSCERFIAGFDPRYYGEFRDLFLHGEIKTPFFTAEQMADVRPFDRQAYIDLCTEYPPRTALEKMGRRADFASLLAKVIPLCGVMMDDRCDEALYRAAIAFCAEKFANPQLSVEDVAGALNISRTKINKLFSEKHHGVKEYINNCRVQYAEMLLRNGNMSVAQVAEESGFAEVRTFNRVFKKKNGLSPSLFRKSHP